MTLVAGAFMLGACAGDGTSPVVSGGGIDLSGSWVVADSTVYDVTNTVENADGLRHVGAYTVTGRAVLSAVTDSSYSAQLLVTVTYFDSVPGGLARRSPQTASFFNGIAIVSDTIYGLAAGGEIVPAEANASHTQVNWAYDSTSGQCRTMLAGFHPATASCRQVLHWTR